MSETFTDDILLYLQVLINKICPIDTVCHNPPHMSGRQNHILRLLFVKKTLHSNPVEQIQLFMRTPYQMGVTLFLQILPNSRSHQSMMPGYIYFGTLFHTDSFLI